MPTDRERGVERLIELAEQAMEAGDEKRAFSLATQARVLSPGDIRIQKIFQGEATRSNRGKLLLWVGVVVIALALTAVGFAVAVS